MYGFGVSVKLTPNGTGRNFTAYMKNGTGKSKAFYSMEGAQAWHDEQQLDMCLEYDCLNFPNNKDRAAAWEVENP